MTEQGSIPKDRQDALLKEYEVCQQTANQVGARAWQLTSVLGVVTIGGIWLILKSGLHGPAIVLFGLWGMFLAWMWMVLVYRHVRNQRVLFHRLHEIENTLGLWAGQYVYLLDHSSKDDSGLKANDKEDEKAQDILSKLTPAQIKGLTILWSNLDKMKKRFLASGLEGQKALSLTGYLAIGAWAALIIGELFYVGCWSKQISECWRQCGLWLVIAVLALILIAVIVAWILTMKFSKKDC